MMVRYQNRNNYLRIVISKSQGIVRLEKKTGGLFSTLVFNGRPPEMGSTIDLKVYVIDDQVFVYVNNEPLFSAQDNDLASGGPLATGTIALFTYSPAEFDNIVIGELDSVPRMIVAKPTAYSVFSTDEHPLPHEINVSARAVNVPSGGGVQFILDSGAPYNDFTPPYSRTFSNVSAGEHQVAAKIINSSGQPIMHTSGKDRDTNNNIGIGGKYLILFGDSITNGVGDNSNDVSSGTQNNSANGKNLNRGIAPALNDLISSRISAPVVVFNEGLGGTIADEGLERLQSTIDRHKKDQLDKIIWLILFGTNDSSWSTPIPAATFKSKMNNIILEIKAIGDIPILGKVPYVIDAPAKRIQAIQDYNAAIDELTSEHGLAASPPDFYNHFLNNTSELADDVHPNGIGYGSMAEMWFCELVASGIIPGTEPPYCGDYEY
jgi:lysophospholipase L1-like esterase